MYDTIIVVLLRYYPVPGLQFVRSDAINSNVGKRQGAWIGCMIWGGENACDLFLMVFHHMFLASIWSALPFLSSIFTLPPLLFKWKIKPGFKRRLGGLHLFQWRSRQDSPINLSVLHKGISMWEIISLFTMIFNSIWPDELKYLLPLPYCISH